MNDPVGDAIELNTLRNLLALEEKAWQTDTERFSRYYTATLIQSIEKQIAQYHDDNGGRWYMPWRYLTYSGPTLDHIAQFYKKAEVSKTITDWNQVMKQYKTVMSALETKYVATLNNAGLKAALEYDYPADSAGAEHQERNAATDFTLTVAQILQGGIYSKSIYDNFEMKPSINVPVPSGSLLEYWKLSLTTSNSILYRALFRNNTQLISAFQVDFNQSTPDADTRLFAVTEQATSSDQEKDYWLNNARLTADGDSGLNALLLPTMAAAIALEGHIQQNNITRLFQRTAVIYKGHVFRSVEGEVALQELVDQLNEQEIASDFAAPIQGQYQLNNLGDNHHPLYIDRIGITLGKNTVKPAIWVVDLMRENRNYLILSDFFQQRATVGGYLKHSDKSMGEVPPENKLPPKVFTYTLKMGSTAFAFYFTWKSIQNCAKKMDIIIGADHSQLVLKFYSGYVALLGAGIQGISYTGKFISGIGQRKPLAALFPKSLDAFKALGKWATRIGLLGDAVVAVASTIDAMSSWGRYLDSAALKEPEAVQRMLFTSVIMFGISVLLAVVAIVLTALEMLVAAIIVGILAVIFNLAGNTWLYFADGAKMTPLDHWLHRTCFSSNKVVQNFDGEGSINPALPEHEAYVWRHAEQFPRALNAFKALSQGLMPQVSLMNEYHSLEVSSRLFGPCSYPVFEFYALLPHYKPGVSAYQVLAYVETVEGNQNPGSANPRLPSDRARYQIIRWQNNIGAAAPEIALPSSLRIIGNEFKFYGDKPPVLPEEQSASDNPEQEAVYPLGGKYILTLRDFTWESFVGAVLRIRYWENGEDIYNYSEIDYIEVFHTQNAVWRPLTFCPVPRQ